MTTERAETIVRNFLSPLATEDFFRAVGQRSVESIGFPNDYRVKLLGDDPRHTIVQSYATHAQSMKCYRTGSGPPAPPLQEASSAEEFHRTVRGLHDSGFTVRILDVTPLSPHLGEVIRALETLLQQPVQSALFWSQAEAKAIVHYDNRDNIVVQVHGRKRWFISNQPPGLQNRWKQIGEPPPELSDYRIVDAGPGDLIYIPRGTPHSVESLSESLHLAILFVPTTIKDVVAAALDHLADQDRALRETAFGRAAELDLAILRDRVSAALERLAGQCGSQDFIAQALDLSASRMVNGLEPLPRPEEAAARVTPATVVQHTPLAIFHLRETRGVLDFAVPGDHLAIHPGVEKELRFISTTTEFRVADLPRNASIDVQILLIERLIAVGLLQIRAEKAVDESIHPDSAESYHRSPGSARPDREIAQR